MLNIRNIQITYLAWSYLKYGEKTANERQKGRKKRQDKNKEKSTTTSTPYLYITIEMLIQIVSVSCLSTGRKCYISNMELYRNA